MHQTVLSQALLPLENTLQVTGSGALAVWVGPPILHFMLPDRAGLVNTTEPVQIRGTGFALALPASLLARPLDNSSFSAVYPSFFGQ